MAPVLARACHAPRDREKIVEALGLLSKIDDIKKIAGTLRGNAGKIEQQSEDVRAALPRLLNQAQ